MVVGFRQSDEFSFGLQPAVREMEGPVTSTRSEKKKVGCPDSGIMFQSLFGNRNRRFAICFELRSTLFSTLYGLWRFDIPMHTDYRYFEVCSSYVFYLVENSIYACNVCFIL